MNSYDRAAKKRPNLDPGILKLQTSLEIFLSMSIPRELKFKAEYYYEWIALEIWR